MSNSFVYFNVVQTHPVKTRVPCFNLESAQRHIEFLNGFWNNHDAKIVEVKSPNKNIVELERVDEEGFNVVVFVGDGKCVEHTIALDDGAASDDSYVCIYDEDLQPQVMRVVKTPQWIIDIYLPKALKILEGN